MAIVGIQEIIRTKAGDIETIGTPAPLKIGDLTPLRTLRLDALPAGINLHTENGDIEVTPEKDSLSTYWGIRRAGFHVISGQHIDLHQRFSDTNNEESTHVVRIDLANYPDLRRGNGVLVAKELTQNERGFTRVKETLLMVVDETADPELPNSIHLVPVTTDPTDYHI